MYDVQTASGRYFQAYPCYSMAKPKRLELRSRLLHIVGRVTVP